jgi:hypothetical protein
MISEPAGRDRRRATTLEDVIFLVEATRGVKEEYCFGKFMCKLNTLNKRSVRPREWVSANHLL